LKPKICIDECNNTKTTAMSNKNNSNEQRQDPKNALGNCLNQMEKSIEEQGKILSKGKIFV
jgi:hypothetical protein